MNRCEDTYNTINVLLSVEEHKLLLEQNEQERKRAKGNSRMCSENSQSFQISIDS